MKSINSTALLCILMLSFANQARVKAIDIKTMEGSWSGTLTYLDYSSNKSVTIPSNITIVQSAKDENTFIVSTYYSDEPKANNIDSMGITAGGKQLAGYHVLSNTLKQQTRTIVASTKGIDGNDDKPATVKKTYIIQPNILTIKKEVQFEGTKNWITRHTYHFTKT